MQFVSKPEPFEASRISVEASRYKGTTTQVRGTVVSKRMTEVKSNGAMIKTCLMELKDVEIIGEDVTIDYACAISPAFFFRGKGKQKASRMDTVVFSGKLRSGNRNTAEFWNCRDVSVIPFQTGMLGFEESLGDFTEVDVTSDMPFQEAFAM